MNLEPPHDRMSKEQVEIASLDVIEERLIRLLHSRMQSVPEYVELVGNRIKSAPLPINPAQLRTRSIDCASQRIQLAKQLGHVRGIEPAEQARANLKHVAASCLVAKGQDHYLLGQPCQDAAVLHLSPELIIAAVSDGVGSVPFSEIGSEFATAALVFEASRLIKSHDGTLLSATLLGDLHSILYQRFHVFAQKAGLSAIAAYNLCLSFTLNFAIITPQETLMAGLGDGRLRLGAQSFRALDRCPRPDALKASRVPPLLAAAYANEKTLARETQTLAEMRQAREQGQFSPSRAELLLDHRIAQAQEAWGFYLYAHETTASALEHGIEICSDGIDYATSEGAHQSDFPIRDLIDELGADLAGRIVRLHGLAQGPDCYAINRSDPVRIPIITEILKDVASVEASMLREAIQKELSTGGSLSTLCPSEMRNLDCDAFISALGRSPRDKVELMEALEGIASRTAFEIIATLTRRAGGTDFWRSMPTLRDDISVVRVKRAADILQS